MVTALIAIIYTILRIDSCQVTGALLKYVVWC